MDLLDVPLSLVPQCVTTAYRILAGFHLKGPATELHLGCARADRSAERWLELLRIRFDQLVLPRPVIATRLQSGMTQALQAESACLNFHTANDRPARRYSIAQLAERLIARIGEQSVHSITLIAEHRPQYAWRAQSLLSDWASSTLSEFRRIRDKIKEWITEEFEITA